MKYFIGLVLLVGSIAIGYTCWYDQQPTGTVIILNGPSAAGKTSIQKEFQQIMMPKLWIKLGIDTLFDAPLPNITAENIAFWQKENSIRWVESTKDSEGHNLITLYVGPDGDRVAYAMNSAIAAYAKQGCSIIVDYIAYKAEWITDLKRKLKNIKTHWVKVAIPLEVLEEREKARGTSPVGHARSHYNYVYDNIDYDLQVSPHIQSAAEIAQLIKVTFKF